MWESTERVSKLMKKRAFAFMCSYRTAWEQHMSDREKEGQSYHWIIDYTARDLEKKKFQHEKVVMFFLGAGVAGVLKLITMLL